MIAEKYRLAEIPCPLCGRLEFEKVYERKQHAGEVLGIIHVQLVMCESCGFVFMNPRPPEEIMMTH